MCLFITEWTSIGFHCKGLFRTNKRTPYGWSWLPGLCIVISVHKICIADGLPWMPDPYRDPRDTQNRCHRRHSVRIATGHQIFNTILGTLAIVDCWDICIGASKGNPVQWQWIIFGLCPYVVTGVDIISPYHTIPYYTRVAHTIPYHTIQGSISSHNNISYHTVPYRLTIPYHTG